MPRRLTNERRYADESVTAPELQREPERIGGLRCAAALRFLGALSRAKMIRAFSFPVSPERSRLRGWLEGTLAGLCELHLLRERQERRVRQALRIATESPSKHCDGETGGETAPEDQLDALPGLMWELEQQLGLLRLYPEKSCEEAAETESWPSSGFYEGPQSAVASDSPASGFGDSSSGFPSASGSYSRIGHASERPKSVGDVANSNKEGVTRGTVPRSFSAPYSGSQDYPAEPLPGCYPPDPFLYPSPLHAVALQNPLLRSHLYEDSAFPSAAPQGYPPGRTPPAVERGSSTPSPCGHEGGATAATRIWSSWDAAAERTLAAKAPAEDFSPPHSSLKKPPKLQALAHMRPPSADQPPSGGAGQDPVAYEAEDGTCVMVKAQYIPAQQPPRAQQSHRAGKKKPPTLAKGRSVELSPERAPLIPRERPRVSAPPKKCRFTEEGVEVAGKKGAVRRSSPRSRKAARSQSENSLLNKPGVKCGAAEREEAALRPARQRRCHGNAAGGYRKWRSTAEICQEEPPAGTAVEPRRSRHGVGTAGCGYVGSDSECSAEPARQAPMCRLEEGLAYGDSESSLSDGDSPPAYSSGASSDTDESGGLVWPQQLSPQLVSASGPGKVAGGQPKVFVKIKASHALKKKIMRFRSGSLKVMTTV
ncbi:hypothetical protein lerEdw1_009869 [Lerista edwardsae]|nr:hypothetical protein lerEdw1_009869 [Lerista edwardsae]